MVDSPAEMVKFLKSGVRVKKGRDWNYGVPDIGNSEGIITGSYTSLHTGGLLYTVKWDCKIVPNVPYSFRMDEGKYDLQIVDFALPSTDKPLAKKLFLDKTFTDFKIKCQGKIYECHRCVLGSQSNVFQAMFLNMDMKEGASGEVEIKDVTLETMAMLLYYFYHEELEDTKSVDTNLLFAAEKYNVLGLLKLCVEHLKASLSIDNVLDILLCAHLTNQKDLFNTASNFVMKNKGKLTETMEWKEMMETNPKLIATVLSNVLGLQK
jgi:hypothetical protein